MRRVIPVLAISFFVLLLTGDFFLSGCATRSTPTGGPRDTTAPSVDTSFPANGSLFFKGNKLRIQFNEYISLKNPSQQISFSPPLKIKPKFTMRGEEVVIEWSDTLQENTTYTISFGEAITDFTEGNVNDRLKLVFSTGSYLDSLALSGKVVDSKTGAPEKQFLVALYDQRKMNGKDSLPFKEMPSYYTYTDEEGLFSLENLRYGSFHVIAFDDKRGNFHLNTGAEKIGFLIDSLALNDSSIALIIQTFQPKGPDRFYGAKHIAYGQIQLPFSYEPDSLIISEISSDSLKPEAYLTWEEKKDTMTYWFDQGKRDSLVLVVNDGMGLADSATIYLRPFKTKELEIAPLYPEFPYSQNIQFRIDRPVSQLEADRIIIYAGKDTLKPDTAYLTGDRRLTVVPQKRPGELTCYFMEGAVTTYDGGVNDSLTREVKTLRKNELGNVNFGVVTDYDSSMVLMIINEAGELIEQHQFKREISIELKNQRPGIYQAEIIIDRDNNGQWSTGDYLRRRPAERIIQYLENIEVRANWDLELVWEASITDP